MDSDLASAREVAFEVLRGPFWLRPWLFEYTPPTPSPATQTFREAVRNANLVIWLLKERTTRPVELEIREALDSQKPILAFRFPATTRDDLTERLWAQTRTQAKTADVASIDDLRMQLTDAIGDEIARAWRRRASGSVAARLEDELQLSRARCIVRWRAAGLSDQEALSLYSRPEVGAPPPQALPTVSTPLKVLVGDFGSGKSLAGERAFAAYAQAYLSQPDAPYPVFVEAQTATGSLIEVAEELSVGGTAFSLVVDGLDELGLSRAEDYLVQARLIVSRWPSSSVLMTSRPIATLASADESVSMPQLEESASLELARLASGANLSQGALSSLPYPLRDAVRRPLFALLIGRHWRHREIHDPYPSTGQLIAEVVQRAVRHSDLEHARLDALLQRLAVLSVERDGFVPAHDLGSQTELDQLIETRLVVLRGRSVGFSLPILAQWCAAQAILMGDVSASTLVDDEQILERWRYPLAVAVGTGSTTAANATLAPIVRRRPGFAVRLIQDATRRWGGREEGVGPPWPEAGALLRASFSAWGEALGGLTCLFWPELSAGEIPPLGVDVGSNGWLAAGWYRGSEHQPPVSRLPSRVGPLQTPGAWNWFRSGAHGTDAAWAWKWSLEEIGGQLDGALKNRTIPVHDALASESAWDAAIALARRGSEDQRPIPVAEVQPILNQLAGVQRVSDFRDTYHLEPLRQAVSAAVARGDNVLHHPWPVRDLELTGSVAYIWDGYSEPQLLRRTAAIYTAVLEAFESVTSTWFDPLRSRMPKASMLPARLIGIVVAKDGLGPSMSWYLDPLIDGSRSRAEIELGSDGYGWEKLDEIHERVRRARPATDWVGAHLMSQVLDVFGSAPATEILYKWIRDDLRAVGLIDRL